MKNILIIDDDEFILFALSQAIGSSAENVEVLTAQHGKQAVDILRSRSVNAIVTDLKMPVMNGYEVVEYAQKNHPEVPVFVMTGDYLPDVKKRFRSGSVAQFVAKPFSFGRLAVDIMDKLAAMECAVPA